MHELQEAVIRLQKGVRDPEAAKKALEQISKDREELRKRIGTVDIVNGIIRDLRDS